MTHWRRNRRGGSTTGCLFSLLVFAAVLYYGVHIGEVYWRYYQIQDEMRSQARLAPSLTDAVIRRRLLVKLDELDLPPEAQRLKIARRMVGPTRTIIIETEYNERVELPLFNHTFTLRPRAEAPL